MRAGRHLPPVAFARVVLRGEGTCPSAPATAPLCYGFVSPVTGYGQVVSPAPRAGASPGAVSQPCLTHGSGFPSQDQGYVPYAQDPWSATPKPGAPPTWGPMAPNPPQPPQSDAAEARIAQLEQSIKDMGQRQAEDIGQMREKGQKNDDMSSLKVPRGAK